MFMCFSQTALSSQSTTNDPKVNPESSIKPETTEASSFFGYMLQLFTEASFVMFFITQDVW